MTVTTRLHTLFTGKLVGTDQFGNSYYTEKKQAKGRRTKRWVMYKPSKKAWWQWALVFPILLTNRLAVAEPSKVPPEWHGWLHYTLDKPPADRMPTRHAWEKPHLPNLTGTPNAYVPPGHLLRGGKRDLSTSDYEPWQP
jgi:NADH:ubiquinone oxidoreductase subunit